MAILVDSVEAPLGAPVVIAPYLSKHTWSRGGLVLNDRGVWPRYWVRETGLRDSADVEDRRDPSPGAHGEVPRHAVRRGKTVPYAGTVEGRTLAEVWVARERLLSAFSELNPEGRMTVALAGIFPLAMGDGTFARAPDVFYDARPLQVTCPDVPPAPRPGYYTLDFSLALRMSDARLLETVQQGPVTLTPYALGGASTSTTVNNPGTADSDPTFTISGPFTAAYLVNDTVGELLVLRRSVPAGSSVVVDFATRTVLLGSTDVGADIDYSAGGWWDETTPGLVPGDNVLRVAMEGIGAGSAGDVRYYPAHH